MVGKQATESWRHLLRGVVTSGLRLVELLNISWNKRQTIQPRWRGDRLPMLWFPAHLQKNRKSQEIPLCPWFEQLLEQTPLELRTGWVFNPESLETKFSGRTYRGKRLSSSRVSTVVCDIGEQAKIVVDEGNHRTGSAEKYASMHDLRRTFAQRLADSDLPPELTSKLMRHADPRTTRRYYLVANAQRDAEKIRHVLGDKMVPNSKGYHKNLKST